jgi:hypothetical protein
MRLRTKPVNAQGKLQTSKSQRTTTEEEESIAVATRDARFRIYSCVFCQFVRDNLSESELTEKSDTSSDVFESKYLYHLMSVHGLRR